MRCPAIGDGGLIYEAVKESLPELRQFITSAPWAAAEPSVDSSEVFSRIGNANFLARKDLPFLIFSRETGAFIGCTGLHRPDWEVPKFELGYWIRTSQSGKGFVTEAIRTLAGMAENELSAARLEIFTDSANQKSRAVAERTGFHLDATLVNYRRKPDGALQDYCLYARTRNAA